MISAVAELLKSCDIVEPDASVNGEMVDGRSEIESGSVTVVFNFSCQDTS